jgi:hypothetical protein
MLRELEEVRDHDFAYPDVYKAIDIIEKKIADHVDKLKPPFPNRRDLKAAICLEALADAHVYLPFLGVIVRSAAVRNAFEMYGPIRTMVQKLFAPINTGAEAVPLTLNTDVRLILSSGWDYTSLTFRRDPLLSDFIFLILPSSEASNPLLIPLAGHEFGHAVWEREGLGEPDAIPDQLSIELTKYVQSHSSDFPDSTSLQSLKPEEAREQLETDSKYKFYYSEACRRLTRQAEELFCDFVGLYLFGESFVHAFTYFLSPDFPLERSLKYPTVKTRIDQLFVASQQFEQHWNNGNYDLPADIIDEFEEKPSAIYVHSPKQQSVEPNPWQNAVDYVAEHSVSTLVGKIIEFGNRQGWQSLRTFSTTKRNEIRDKAFYWAVPAEHCESLPNILNAAWDVERSQNFWDHLTTLYSIPEEQRNDWRRDVLRELVLKNIEVLEYDDITG